MPGMSDDPMVIGRDMVERLKSGARLDITKLNGLIKMGITKLQEAFAGVILPPQVQLALRVPGIETIVLQVLMILNAQLMEDMKALQSGKEEIHKKIVELIKSFFAMVVKAGFGVLKKSWNVADGMIDDMAYMLGDIQTIMDSKSKDDLSSKILEVMDNLDTTHGKKRKIGGRTRRKRTRKRKLKPHKLKSRRT